MAVQPIARRLTDTQLVSAQFRYSDPENSISDLNRGIPDPTAHPTIIGYYDETPPGGRKANPDFPYVRCCHCGKRRHWRGHVVRDDQGESVPAIRAMGGISIATGMGSVANRKLAIVDYEGAS